MTIRYINSLQENKNTTVKYKGLSYNKTVKILLLINKIW